MSSEIEDRIERRITELCRSMDRGFEDLRSDLHEVKTDVKKIYEAAIPHRVGELEQWRDGITARMWTIFIGSVLAAGSAWFAVIIK